MNNVALARNELMAGSVATHVDAVPELLVQVIYEDREAGLRAKRTLDRLEPFLPAGADLHSRFWRFDLLNEPTLRDEVGNETMKADMVVLSTHGLRGLPEAVNTWLAGWIAQKIDQPAALVVLLHALAQESASARQILDSVEPAHRTGVEVFVHFGQLDRSESNSAIESIQHRAHTVTSLLAEGMQRTELQFRHWGINE